MFSQSLQKLFYPYKHLNDKLYGEAVAKKRITCGLRLPIEITLRFPTVMIYLLLMNQIERFQCLRVNKTTHFPETSKDCSISEHG